MKGILIKGDGPITVKTDKGIFPIHKDSLNRRLRDYKDGEEMEVQLSTEGCPFNYTSRCTMGRCDCEKKLYAILKGLYI